MVELRDCEPLMADVVIHPDPTVTWSVPVTTWPGHIEVSQFRRARIPRSGGLHPRVGRRDTLLPQHPAGFQRALRRHQQPSPGPTPSRTRLHELRHLQKQSTRDPHNMSPHRNQQRPAPRFRSLSYSTSAAHRNPRYPVSLPIQPSAGFLTTTDNVPWRQ